MERESTKLCQMVGYMGLGNAVKIGVLLKKLELKYRNLCEAELTLVIGRESGQHRHWCYKVKASY